MKAESKMANLYNSCRAGNLPKAKKQLEGGADVNFCHPEDGLTCLMVAVMHNNQEIVSLLLEKPGIDVNAKRFGFRDTALHFAIQRFGKPAILRMLLDFPGIDREAEDGFGTTPLMESINNGTVAQFAEFLKIPTQSTNICSYNLHHSHSNTVSQYPL